MTPELEALARRAVACPRWRWMPGMLVTSMGRIIEVDGDLVSAFEHPWIDGQFEFRKLDSDCAYVPALPDLTDFATLGCLVALVREAHGPSAVARLVGVNGRGDQEWAICDRSPAVDGWHVAAPALGYWESEIEALVAALENGAGGV
jgi:hypothetical protein